jgi:hypothetical protein
MRTEKGGTSLAAERAGRLRALFEPTPAEIVFDLNLRRRNVELGDVLAITHHELPDLLTGVFGVAEKTVLVVGVVPEFERGVVKVRCLELTFQRYGAIGPDSLADYDAASAADRKAYAFIGRELDNKVGTALDAGYVVV